MAEKGKLIVFEGGEGSGKSTQVRHLETYLRGLGQKVIVTREPGGSPNAELIRDIIVRGREDKLSPLTETLLLYAARNDHIEKTIKPALDQGYFVICDRFVASTYAYQQGVDVDLLHTLTDAVVLNGLVWPSLTFFLDLPPEVGLMRRHAANTRQGDETSRFELKDIDFHKAVHASFDNRCGRNKAWIRVDAMDEPMTIAMAIANEVRARFLGHLLQEAPE
jgi:dTMP kinase